MPKPNAKEKDIIIFPKDHEEFKERYMRDLQELYNAYFYALITEIYVGVGINLGLSEKEAYKLAKTDPSKLQKASWFSDTFNRFKKFFKFKVRKFRYNNRKLFSDKTKPLTPEQWDDFNRNISDYWKEHARQASEAMGLQSFLLGRQTTEYLKTEKPYEKKTLNQVVEDQFPDGIPTTIAEAYKKYNFKDSEKKIINRTQSTIATYVTETDNSIQEAIRKQVIDGMNDDKTPVQIASDLYWNVQGGSNSAEGVRKNWNRIAVTEMASAKTQGELAPYEADAMESMKDPSKAQYFARSNGSCDWCKSVEGTILRLIPQEIADPSTDKLSDIGIKDPYTNRYTYIGMNNVGLKKDKWRPGAVPGHPHNRAFLSPINPATEFYNEKTDSVEKRQKGGKFMPKMPDYSEMSENEKKERKPKKISENRVRFNNNEYIAVSKEEYNTYLERSRKDPDAPTPVSIGSPAHKRIFGAIE